MNELKEKKQAGDKAKRLLKDPAMISALQDMKNYWFNEIQTTKARENDKREECYRMLKSLEQFERVLQFRINEGKMAENAMVRSTKAISRILRTQY